MVGEAVLKNSTEEVFVNGVGQNGVDVVQVVNRDEA
jgi:CTP synthase